jgi:4-hydroxybenzoate polyprenyltransferase
LNQVWIAIPRGLFGILASWSVFGDPFTKEPLFVGFLAMIFFIGSMSTKDIVDAVADKQTGTKTLVNTFGIKKTAYISLPFLMAPFVFFLPLFIYMRIIGEYLWPMIFFAIPSFIVFYLMLTHKESQSLENVQAWAFMYIEYLFFAIGFSVLVIFEKAGILFVFP